MHKQQDIRSAPKGPNRASNQPTKNTVNTGIHLAFFKTETHQPHDQRSRLFSFNKETKFWFRLPLSHAPTVPCWSCYALNADPHPQSSKILPAEIQFMYARFVTTVALPAKASNRRRQGAGVCRGGSCLASPSTPLSTAINPSN